ncbi:hypothetical protein [Thermaerobacter litoralis]
MARVLRRSRQDEDPSAPQLPLDRRDPRLCRLPAALWWLDVSLDVVAKSVWRVPPDVAAMRHEAAMGLDIAATVLQDVWQRAGETAWTVRRGTWELIGHRLRAWRRRCLWTAAARAALAEELEALARWWEAVYGTVPDGAVPLPRLRLQELSRLWPVLERVWERDVAWIEVLGPAERVRPLEAGRAVLQQLVAAADNAG